jgi:hypothetical protein
MYAGPTELSARTAMLERTPAPRGRPGGPGLYDVEGMGHTAYYQQVVKALIEKRGMPPGKAYAIARAAIRKWSARSKHPEVRGAATRAEAGEIERQGRARASHGHAISPWEITGALIELAVLDLGSPPGGPQSKNWMNEQRVAAGQAGGGQFGKGQQQQKQKQARRKQQAAKQEHRHDKAQRAVLLRKIAGIRQQIAALQAMLPKPRGATKAGAAKTPAQAAAAAKRAAAAKSKGATPRKKGTAAKKLSPATIHARIGALQATLRADLAQLRTL